jgi:DNA adenine methylase
MLSTQAAAEPLAPIDPIRPPAPWIGGKKVLARRLVARINAVPHTIYAEPSWAWAGSSSAATSARNAR